MDILSAINEYTSFANILMENPKELIPKSFSERARVMGETAYMTTIGQVSAATGKESIKPVFASI